MNTDPVLTLAQWFSPSFPIGAFAYSHGMEQAIAQGDVHDCASLSDWVDAVLRHGSGLNDAVFIAAAHLGDPREVDAYARAFVASSERLMETDLQGAAFGKIAGDLAGLDLSGFVYPVAVGAAARSANLPLELTISMCLQAFVSNLVSVGMRLIPLGQTEGHRIIAALSPICLEIAQISKTGDFALLANSAIGSDIAAMRHETLTSRVFRT